MWGTFLSEPLRIVASVSRYLTDWLMRRMPILVRIAPFLLPGCPGRIYAGLARLSAGCPPDKGRLHTCYSPVRRSPAGRTSPSPAAPRLACVKPAASVHPEPGSNSPLLVFLFFLFLVFQRHCLSGRIQSIFIDGSCTCVPAFLVLIVFCCSISMYFSLPA